MKCTNCGFERSNVFIFCPKCGTKHQPIVQPSSPESKLEYFESDVPESVAYCSDNSCPCSGLETFSKGQGYLYIDESLVSFRRQYPTLKSARAAMERKQEQMRAGEVSFGGFYRLGPIFLCERGARQHGLDLEVAAADARHWWDTGQVPLRASPLAGSRMLNTAPPPLAVISAESPAAVKPVKVKKETREKKAAEKAESEKVGAEIILDGDKRIVPPELDAPPAIPPAVPPVIPPELSKKIKEKKPFDLNGLWLAIANLNLFGLGYWLSGKKLRGILCMVGGVLILVAGHLLNASKHPLLWGLLFLALFIGIAVDLWLLLRRKPAELAPVLQKSKWLLPVLAILVNVIFYGGFFLYRSLGIALYEKGQIAYENNDEYTAFGNWYALSRYYRLSLNRQVVEVQEPLGEVSMLINTRNLMEQGEYAQVLNENNRFNKLYPLSDKAASMEGMGFYAYLGLAQDLAEKKEFDAALEKLNTVEVAFPALAETSQKKLEDAYMKLYLGWGDHLTAQEDYAGAVEKYEYLLHTYTYPERVEYKAAYLGGVHANFQWGIQLRSQGEYQLAAEKFEYLIEKYELGKASAEVAGEVNDQAAQTYVEWAKQLSAENDHTQAVTKLQIVLDSYKDSSSASEAAQLLPEEFLGWGKELSSGQHYRQALEKFGMLQELGASSTVIQDAQQEIEKTILLLAADTGVDGQAVLEEARKQSCTSVIPTHPSVGILTDEPGKILNCYGLGVSGSSNWTIPAELLAAYPGNFQFTVLRVSDSRQLGSCPYTGGRVMYRLQDMEVVTIHLVATGEVVAEKTFYGGYPGACPFVHTFYGLTSSMMGDMVSNSDINDWIAEVIQ